MGVAKEVESLWVDQVVKIVKGGRDGLSGGPQVGTKAVKSFLEAFKKIWTNRRNSKSVTNLKSNYK